jgi:hypothetical protein
VLFSTISGTLQNFRQTAPDARFLLEGQSAEMPPRFRQLGHLDGCPRDTRIGGAVDQAIFA